MCGIWQLYIVNNSNEGVADYLDADFWSEALTIDGEKAFDEENLQ